MLFVGGLAFVGGQLGRQGGQGPGEGSEPGRCAYDRTRIQPLYEVEAFLLDGSSARFCSIHCALGWVEQNPGRALYVTVTDEVSAERLDSSLAHFVESDVVTVPEVKNRVHAFASPEDARAHAAHFNGRIVENPFGKGFELPPEARAAELVIGVPAAPDSVPLRLAVFRPIFKENRVQVRIAEFQHESEAARLLEREEVDGIVCDLPAALLLAAGRPSLVIVKNVLRANPYRALFALVGALGLTPARVAALERIQLAVPEGVSYDFYAERFLQSLEIPPEKVSRRAVGDLAEAWESLRSGEVTAALLRTPYTDIALKEGLSFLADDRNWPWMSVVLLRQSLVEDQSEALRRFVFSLEQAVLALNTKPDAFRAVLEEQGGIPKAFRKRFPMPIFEGGNAPSADEVEPVMTWLAERGLAVPGKKYEDMVDPRFLPNPQDVGLAFCCR